MGFTNVVDDIADIAKRVATSVWGDGAGRGLLTTEQEIGSTIVSGAEHSAAKDILRTLKRNGATFDERKVSDVLESSFNGNGTDLWNREDLYEELTSHITKGSNKAIKKSAEAIKAYQEGGGKIQKYLEANGSGAAAREYIGRKDGGLGLANASMAYFTDSQYGRQRVGAVLGTAAAADIGMRTLQGGNLTTTATGEKNIAGVPFF